MAKKTDLRAVVTHMEPRMQEIMPAGVSYSRLASVVLSVVQANPKLAECSKTSFATALMECARLGLEPGGGKGLVYLIPRAGKVTVQVGYKGLIEMGQRSGKIASISANTFYKEEVDAGLFTASHEPPEIHHRCGWDLQPTEVAGAYAIAHLKNGQRVQMILTRADLENRRSRAQGGGKTGPWKDDYPAMARKSALRALFSSGLIPLSDAMAYATDEVQETQRAFDRIPDVLQVDVPDETPPDDNKRALAAMRDSALPF